MLRITICVMLLVCMANARTITLKPPSAPGIHVTLANNPTMRPMIAHDTQRNTNASTADALPYSVVLKNDAPRKIIAYTLRYAFVSTSGKASGLNRLYLNVSGEDNGIEIPAGTEQLISPLESKRCCRAAVVPLHQQKVVANFDAQESVTVTLDLVVYEDGTTVGADESGTMNEVQHYVSAPHEMASLVLASSREGLRIEEIKGKLRKIVDAPRSVNPAVFIRASAARHMLMAAELGKEALMAKATEWLRFPAITLHKGDGR